MEEFKAIKKQLKALETEIEKEPYVLLRAGAEPVVSAKAKAFMTKANIDHAGFLSKLRIEAQRCCKTNYGGLEAVMMHLPGKSNAVIALLRKANCQPGQHCTLTEKEKEVLVLLAKGMSNKEIASILGISPGTVNTHLDNIYRKLGATNRLKACFVAIKSGFIGTD